MVDMCLGYFSKSRFECGEEKDMKWVEKRGIEYIYGLFED